MLQCKVSSKPYNHGSQDRTLNTPKYFGALGSFAWQAGRPGPATVAENKGALKDEMTLRGDSGPFTILGFQ